MTPEEARKLWCPMTQAYRPGTVLPEGSLCIADQCAWWHDTQRIARSRVDDQGRESLEYEWHGYCGAAPPRRGE